MSVTKKMKAVVYDEFGGPEVLTLREVYSPVVKSTHVLIKVAATTVNRIDLRRRKGRYSRINYGMGIECSGTIVRTGYLVKGWKEGDEVVDTKDELGPRVKVALFEVCALVDQGAYADFVAVPAQYIISAPKNLDLVYAAALPCAACLIWNSFFVMNNLTGGKKVLIHGGAGGIGSLAIQIAKHYGCQVFATAGSKERVQFCASLGADICINHKEEDFSERVKSVTEGTGVDYILDSHGTSFFKKNMCSLAFGGKFIIIGSESGFGDELDYALLNCQFLAGKELEVMGANVIDLNYFHKERLLQLVKEGLWPLIEKGLITPRISKTYVLPDAAEAHRLMEKNGHLGKILLTPLNT